MRNDRCAVRPFDDDVVLRSVGSVTPRRAWCRGEDDVGVLDYERRARVLYVPFRRKTVPEGVGYKRGPPKTTPNGPAPPEQSALARGHAFGAPMLNVPRLQPSPRVDHLDAANAWVAQVVG